MNNLIISEVILEKLLTKHGVTRREVEQCFENRIGPFLEDTREDHKSDPPTLWFVAPTNQHKLLKVVFIYRDGKVYIRSAFEANDAVQKLYNAQAR